MSKILGEYAVHGVLDSKGESHTFLPGAEVPDWAVKQLGDHCFEGGEELFNEDGNLRPVVHHDAVVSDARGGGGASDGPPPHAGKGSSEAAWRKYAEDQGVDVSEVEGRDDLIAACEEAGVPVE